MKQIYLVLTEICNLECKHCIRGEQKNNYIDTNKVKVIVNRLVDRYPNATIVLTGGEPTLHKDFEEILIYTLKLSKRVMVTSNGTTNFYNTVNKYTNYENLIFQISIDGDEKCHDMIRGAGRYNKSMETAKNLIGNGIKVVVATTVTNINFYSLKVLYEDLIKANVKRWYVNNELPFGLAKEGEVKPILREQWNKLVKVMRHNCNELRLNINELYNIEFSNNTGCQKVKTSRNCGSGREKIYIYPDLNVYGCTCLKDFVFGNLSENNLEEVLKSDNANLIVNYKVEQDSVCCKCKFLSECNGGCIGMSYHMFGKLGYGDIRCPKVQGGLSDEC